MIGAAGHAVLERIAQRDDDGAGNGGSAGFPAPDDTAGMHAEPDGHLLLGQAEGYPGLAKFTGRHRAILGPDVRPVH